MLSENHMTLWIVGAVPVEPPPPRTYVSETALALAGIFIAAIAISAAIRRRRR